MGDAHPDLVSVQAWERVSRQPFSRSPAGNVPPRRGVGFGPGTGDDMGYSTGDKVSWNTSQGKTHGTVTEKRTRNFTFAGQQFRPTD
ncbi:MAG TPA: DUF2945 domain-containing protein, partial [Ornithinibacter sp.]|nr:DUF2945 domain-containing protein [Ornithinibacter sp.]